MSGDPYERQLALEKSLFLDLDDVNLEDYAEVKHELKSPSQFATSLMDHFASDPNLQGCSLPWPSATPLKFRSGECSLWSGQNFHGKSALLTQAMLWWMREGFSDKKEKFLVISPEFDPMRNIARWVQQITAKLPGQIEGSDVISSVTWLEGKVLIYDVVGAIEINDICNLIRYAVAEHGITGVLIDNLTVLQLPNSGDTNVAQAELMTRLVEVTRSTKCHLHAVCHTRKPAKGEPVSRYNIRGASQLVDLADNVLCVERNESKEKKLADPSLDDEERRDVAKRADTRLHCLKQRHGTAWVGVVRLYFDVFSMRWSEQQDAAFLSFEEVEDLNNALDARNSRGYQSW